MKNRILIIGTILIALGTAGFIACSKGAPGGKTETGEKGKISHYTCPMHRQIHLDQPGKCPICGMTLIPVYEEGAKTDMDRGPAAMISTERQEQIGITTAEVSQKELTKKIKTVGLIAFDPELAVAQREFVEILRNAPSLKAAGISRLKLLGMSDEEIANLAKARHPSSNLYLPIEGGSFWVYAPIYESEFPFVRAGQKVSLIVPSTQENFTGTVRGIDPVLDPATRSARARIEVPGSIRELKPGGYLDAFIEVDLGPQLALPKSAVVDTGLKQIVFVVHDGTHFQSRQVSLGAETDDDRVVLSGLNEGEMVATSALFLIDSESQLKTAVSGAGETPKCAKGEAWDKSMNMCMPKIGN